MEGEWRDTPPAAVVIYHAMPSKASPLPPVTALVYGALYVQVLGGYVGIRICIGALAVQKGARASLVLIDVIDIGIRRRADYPAVNNSALLSPTEASLFFNPSNPRLSSFSLQRTLLLGYVS